eukprot:1133811-Pelagomonas_calceolata.AAC.9
MSCNAEPAYEGSSAKAERSTLGRAGGCVDTQILLTLWQQRDAFWSAPQIQFIPTCPCSSPSSRFIAVRESVLLGHLHLHGTLLAVGAAGLLPHAGQQSSGRPAGDGSRWGYGEKCMGIAAGAFVDNCLTSMYGMTQILMHAKGKERRDCVVGTGWTAVRKCMVHAGRKERKGVRSGCREDCRAQMHDAIMLCMKSTWAAFRGWTYKGW